MKTLILLMLLLTSACQGLRIPDGCLPAWQQIAGDERQGSVWAFGILCAPGAAPTFQFQGAPR